MKILTGRVEVSFRCRFVSESAIVKIGVTMKY